MKNDPRSCGTNQRQNTHQITCILQATEIRVVLVIDLVTAVGVDSLNLFSVDNSYFRCLRHAGI